MVKLSMDNFERELLRSIDPNYIRKIDKKEQIKKTKQKKEELKKMLDKLPPCLL